MAPATRRDGADATAVALASLLPTPARASAVTWDGGGTDDAWDTAENWNPNGVPTAADDVIINGNVTVDHGQDTHAVNSLDLRAGSTLNLTGGDLAANGAGRPRRDPGHGGW